VATTRSTWPTARELAIERQRRCTDRLTPNRRSYIDGWGPVGGALKPVIVPIAGRHDTLRDRRRRVVKEAIQIPHLLLKSGQRT
jgi:hypothetical protein